MTSWNRRGYRYNYPDPESTFRIVRNARLEVESEERSLRAEARLWERRVSDDDFGVVRLGMAASPQRSWLRSLPATSQPLSIR